MRCCRPHRSDPVEYQADTDPLEASQRLEVTGFSVFTNDEDPEDVYLEIELTWTSRPACRYNIETANDPDGPWDVEKGYISPGSGDSTTVVFTVSPETRMFIRASAFRLDEG